MAKQHNCVEKKVFFRKNKDSFFFKVFLKRLSFIILSKTSHFGTIIQKKYFKKFFNFVFFFMHDKIFLSFNTKFMKFFFNKDIFIKLKFLLFYLLISSFDLTKSKFCHSSVSLFMKLKKKFVYFKYNFFNKILKLFFSVFYKVRLMVRYKFIFCFLFHYQYNVWSKQAFEHFLDTLIVTPFFFRLQDSYVNPLFLLLTNYFLYDFFFRYVPFPEYKKRNKYFLHLHSFNKNKKNLILFNKRFWFYDNFLRKEDSF